jgi:uncharacterized repeat protein (TIGR01451 family)
LNPGGGTDTSYRGTVYFTSSDAQAALPSNYTFTAADNGVHSFSATLNSAGTQSITATDTVTSTITGTQSGILVNAPNADLSVSLSGPSSGNEGDTVTYTVTVNNAGPSSATGTNLTDTLGSLLGFKSATTSQGTFSASGNVITFSLGTIASGGSATVTISALATEDGSTSNSASVTSSIPDPTTSDNSGSTTTAFAEPPISVSGAIRTHSQTLTNFQLATFTHASGVDPTSAFSATINWGDGTTSAGTIGLSGSTYTVTGSHTYSGGGKHTISTTVTEVTQAVNAALVGAQRGAGGSSTAVSTATSDQHSLGDVALFQKHGDEDATRQSSTAGNTTRGEQAVAIARAWFASEAQALGAAGVDSFFVSNDRRDRFALLWAEIERRPAFGD